MLHPAVFCFHKTIIQLPLNHRMLHKCMWLKCILSVFQTQYVTSQTRSHQKRDQKQNRILYENIQIRIIGKVNKENVILFHQGTSVLFHQRVKPLWRWHTIRMWDFMWEQAQSLHVSFSAWLWHIWTWIWTAAAHRRPLSLKLLPCPCGQKNISRGYILT